MTPEEITQTLQELANLAREYWLAQDENNDWQYITTDLENCAYWWQVSNNIYYDTIRDTLSEIFYVLFKYRFPYIATKIHQLLDAMPEREAE